MRTFYFLAGRQVLEDFDESPPRRGDEVGIDDRIYTAARVVRHKPMCPPDYVHVHLVLAEPEGPR